MIKRDRIAPVSELLERQARDMPDKRAFIDTTRSVTYRELDDQTRNLATHLRANGLVDGGTVAIWLPNSVDWVVACLATVRAGGIAVPVSCDSTLKEAAYRLDDADCQFVVTPEENAPKLDDLDGGSLNVDRRILTTVTGGLYSGPLDLDYQKLCAQPAPGVALQPDDIDRTNYIVYTSGTTGQPKGVQLSTRGMLWVNAACWAPIVGMSQDDLVLSPLPLFHSYALNISVLGVLANGATEFIMERFSTQAAIEQLSSGSYTLMPGVPTMFHYLLEAAQTSGINPFQNVERCVSVGAIMPATLNDAFEAQFGTQLLDGYGITETSTMVTMNWPGNDRVAGSCGLPLPGLAVRIVDPASRNDVAIRDEGELICRGPNLMLGYHNKPTETDAVLRGGW